ncbi:acyl carrier protein [Coprococcus catus]|nr:acyl carrier protein [Coprococcus catus]
MCMMQHLQQEVKRMTRDQVKDIVFRTFTDVIADDEIEITEDSGIMDDLDMDSIEMQEVFSDLEEEFEVEILDSMLKRMITIGDVIDVMTELQGKAD